MLIFMLLDVVKKHWEIIVLTVSICVIASLLVMVFLPFEYKASTQLLIIQKQTQGFDAYTAIKSSERVGKNLAQIVFTSSFYNNVVEREHVVKTFFPEDDIKLRKKWENALSVNVIPETGILQINAFNTDQSKAALLARAVSQVLAESAATYHGNGETIEVKIIDNVIASKYPVRPNIILNTLLALIVGFGLGVAFVLLKDAQNQAETAVHIPVTEPPQDIEEDENEETSFTPLVSPVLETVPVTYETGAVSSADMIVTMHDHLDQ